MCAVARTVRDDLVGSGGDSVAEQRSAASHWQSNVHKADGHSDEGDPRKLFRASHQAHAGQRNPDQLGPEHPTTDDEQIDLAIHSQYSLIVVRLAED
jgi:hypothetical protein